MNRQVKQSARWVIFGLLLAVLVIPASYAQQSSCNIKRKVNAKALTETSFKSLNDIYEDIGDEKYNEAAAALNKMLSRSRGDTYEQAIIHQALAQVEWARERFDAALASFEKAVALDTLPNHAHFALMYQISQLYAMKDRNREALQKLDLWMCTVPAEQVTSAAYVLKASIYAKMENYRESLKAIEQAISMDKNPREPWYQLKLAAHFELEQFPSAADTLKLMIQRWPDKKTYWTQLSSIYVKLKRDKDALAVQAAAYRRGMLSTESEVKQLANLYQYLEIPYKAAAVMEKGINEKVITSNMKNWDLVGQSWYQAEEMDKALAAYKRAGQASSDGKIDLKRAYILVDLENWSEGREALSASLRKGGLEDRKVGEAYLLKGMCEFNLGNNRQAREDFGQATRFERTRSPAQQWINHMNEEQRRQAP